MRRLALVLALLPSVAGAQSLVIGMAAPVTSIDPHYRDLSPNATIASGIFDALTRLDEAARLQPDLAQSWQAVDAQTWEFHLRPGVTFQNGQALTGDDIAFTIARVPRVPNALFTTYTGSIDQVTVTDPLTVRMHTRYVDPLLPLELAQVKIVSHIAAAHADTGDFNSGAAAIGTGPYRLVTYRPGDRVELVRNDQYWGPAPYAQHVIYRTIGQPAAAAGRSEADAGEGGRAAADLCRARPGAQRPDALRHRPEQRDPAAEPAARPAGAAGTVAGDRPPRDRRPHPRRRRHAQRAVPAAGQLQLRARPATARL
jgi:ABC-type transport system substrate-binding protein